MFSGLKSFLDVGHTVCIQMPKRAVIVCFTIQKEIFLLPFRCLSKAYEFLVKTPMKYVVRIYEKETPTAAELLTGEKNPSPETIINSAKELRCSAIKAINKENMVRSQVLAYTEQLDKWKHDNEKRTEEIYKISLEERELMKAIASALRYVKSLKAKREKIDENFSKNLNLNTGVVSAEKLIGIMKQIRNADDVISEKNNDCLNLLNNSFFIEKEINTEAKNFKVGKEKPNTIENVQTLSPSESIQKVFSIVVDENVHLKNRLASTHRKLEEILNLSENINKEIVTLSHTFAKVVSANNEMSNLQQKLDEERELLKAVEADRDQMKYKLEILEVMIKEEESFLGEIFDCEDGDEADSTCILDFVNQLEAS